MNGPLIELREDSPGKLTLRGYASVSERWYSVGRLFSERVRRGTWRQSLNEGPDTVLVQDHGGLAFARTKTPSGQPSLLLSEDERGLRVEAFLDATAPRVQDLRSTSDNCGLQMSVAFLCSEDSWNEDRSKRELIRASVDRGDVTVCNYGANEAAAATITARAAAGEAERRAYAESLKGSRERRMCPDFEAIAHDLRGRSQIAVPALPDAGARLDTASARARLDVARAKRARLTPSYVENAKAKRAHYRRFPASERRLADFPLSPWGKDWEIGSSRDVHRAVTAIEVGHAKGPDEDAIKAWVYDRAKALYVEESVPAGWKGQWKGTSSRSARARRSEKYSQAEKDALARKGLAFRNPDGHGSFPCVDRADVDNAVKAIGRAPASLRPAIRRFIAGRARALKATALIPASWGDPVGATESVGGQSQ